MSWYSHSFGWFEDQLEGLSLLDLDDIVQRAERGDEDCMVAAGVLNHSRKDYPEAMRWLTLAADQENARAMVGVGLMHYKGQGVVQNEAEASRWLRLSALKSNATAMLYLGYQSASANRYPDAIKWFRMSANHDCAQAMTMIAHSYMGQDNRMYEGTQMRDPTEALRWYRLAANAGNPGAMRAIALSHELGEGAETNESEALRWNMLSAGAGDARSMILLALLYDTGFLDEGRSSATKEALNVYPEMVLCFWRRLKAAYWDSVGSDYDFNRDSYDPESSNFASHWALKWLHRAAATTDSFRSDGCFLLGNVYDRKQDYPNALKWYGEMAKAWDAFSMIGVGFLHQEGRGVTQNYLDAIEWYRKAHDAWMGERIGVAKEAAVAPILIGILYALGRGVPQDVDESCRWLEMEPDPGVTPLSASWIASRLYADRFYGEAYYWLLKSMADQLPTKVLQIVASKRTALENYVSDKKKKEVQIRIQSESTQIV